MASKQDFLNNIAKKLGRTRVLEVTKPAWGPHPGEHMFQGLSQKELTSLFEQEMIKLGGEVIRVPSLNQLATAIHSWLRQSKVNRVVSWDVDTPVGREVKKALLAFQPALNLTFWDEQEDREKLITAAEKADAGFTFAEYGLAESGSIILYNRGNAGRLVSLLPNISANVLLAKDIVPRLTQSLAHLVDKAWEYSCINIVTGPSRSADIEMDLSIGVHGPGHLLVFLVEEYGEEE